MRVLELNEGELKVVRRPAAGGEINPHDYLPCKFCYGFFLGDELWRHADKCPFKEGERPVSKETKYSGRHMLTGGMLTEGCKELFASKVLSKMASDEISLIVQNDKTILAMGSQMLEKRGSERSGEVSQKMRLLGRVVKEGRKGKGKETWSLKDFLVPQEFDTLIQCAQTLGGYEQNDGSTSKKTFKSPATTVHCGYELKRAVLILRCQALRQRDKDTKEIADHFLQLYEAEWHNRVAAPALNNLAVKRHNVPQLLPLTTDLLKLRKYLTDELAILTKKVNEKNKQRRLERVS